MDIDETSAGQNYHEAKRNLDEVLKYGRNGYYDFEKLKDPKTGLTDDQIRKELDELNQQIQFNGFDSQHSLFSEDCSNFEVFDYVPKNQPKYKFDPYFTEGAKEFENIRNYVNKDSQGHVKYKVFEEGYENSSSDIFGQMVLYNMAYPPEFQIDRYMQPTFYKYIESQSLLVIFWNHYQADHNSSYHKHSYFEIIKLNHHKNIDRENNLHWQFVYRSNMF